MTTSRITGTIAVAGVLLLGTLPVTTFAATLRYAAIAHGDLAIAGNTLGLAKGQNVNGPGTRDSIGTFVSTDAGAVDAVPANPGNPWPAGTTSQWQQNGSTGSLILPAGSTVLYTELVWGGSYNYSGEDLSAHLDTPVVIEGPQGGSLTVAPDPASSSTLAQTAAGGFAVNYYQRSAAVTTFIAQQGAGSYTVRGVPATQSELNNSLNAAGWALLVAYGDPGAPLRSLSIATDGQFVEESAMSEIVVSGFTAPAIGEVTGRVVVAAIEGDANQTGDQLLLGASTDSLIALATAGNPTDNFFGSQINDANGSLAGSGSFGSVNHDPFGAVNVSGGRQGWDTSGVWLSSVDGLLANGQSEAYIRALTTGDSFVLAALGFAIDQAVPAPVPVPGLGWGVAVLVAATLRCRRGRIPGGASPS